MKLPTRLLIIPLLLVSWRAFTQSNYTLDKNHARLAFTATPEKFPTIEFKSAAFKKIDVKNYKLQGTITIHGITKAIVFDVTYNGKAFNPMSEKSSVGFAITGKLNRVDFIVGTEAFAGVVGKEIELRSTVEFITE